VSYYEPKNYISEQIRTVRTNIEFSGGALDEFKVLMITSAEISDSKSTVSANLATSWAQSGKKTLLIDADMRRSIAHVTFALNNNEGLSTLLAKNGEPEKVVKETFIDNLSVMTAGPVPPNPAELIGSKRMAEVMEWARDHFDLVLVDATPVLAVADAQVALKYSDGIVIVVKMGKTLKGNIQRTVELLKMSNARILGVIERFQKSAERSGGYGYGYVTKKLISKS